MGWFQKKRKTAGRLVVSIQADVICIASIGNASVERPTVEIVATHALKGAQSASDLLAKIAKELRAEYDCINLLCGNEYQLLSVEAPNVPADELKTAIRWRLKDMLDFHIDDATIDVLDVPRDRNAGNRNHSMYAVAARNQLIEQRQALFSDARVSLRVIDIPEMAQRNIAKLFEPEGRGIAMLSFDAQGGLLTMTCDGELYLSRRIDIPFAQLGQDSEEERNAYYERVTLELQRSLDHFDRQYHTITLAKLMLAPLSGAAADLSAYLAGNLYLPVETLDLASVFDMDKTPELKSVEMQQRYFLVLGAALRREEAVL